ncbi:MAG: hypothetical protein LBU76_09820 [Azoarcus sp.]|jgi:hypothetical protein|nr:hypothetical protein [Azoarcus sp.]
MTMTEPHPLTVRFRSSPALLAGILAAHFAGAVALFFMDLPFSAAAPLVLLVACSAVLAVRAQMRKRGLSLVLAKDGALRICQEGGGSHDAWGRALPGAVLFPAVAWFALAWTAQDGRPKRLQMMLIASEVIEDNGGENAQWRRLRTWLRHRSQGSAPDTVSSADAA